MGLIGQLVELFFGGGRNALRETLEIFRVNAEAQGLRDAEARQAALQQFAAEFALQRPGRFDRLIDALNRVPRPALALGTLGLVASAMIDPVWFASRMQGVALIPEPLWWLMGAIVSFYFGARAQAKGAEFRRSVAETVLLAGQVTKNIGALKALAEGADPAAGGGNAALEEWRRGDAG